jgi:hypothetical protein
MYAGDRQNLYRATGPEQEIDLNKRIDRRTSR